MGLMKELAELNAIYQKMSTPDIDEQMIVTNADKKGNTKAYQNYKAGAKGYEAADHLKNEEYAELYSSINEKESYKTVAAVIDYDRSKKGTDDATYDSEHGKKKEAKKERDYAAWEREKMKKDDPNWKHKKGSTSESFSNWRNDLSEVVMNQNLKQQRR